MKRLLISAVRDVGWVHFQVLPHSSMSAEAFINAIGKRGSYFPYANVMADGWVHIHNALEEIKWNACEWCGQQFIFLGKLSRFCCDDCRNAFHRSLRHLVVHLKCTHCGTGYEPKRNTSRFCSTSCRVAANCWARLDSFLGISASGNCSVLGQFFFGRPALIP